ncbi:MAG TPA: hypothetical protein VFK70_20855, partial [Vicinamibacteria bacterium]|nr:hypothetical protein [Vicinamibacteria bacterium]
DRQRISLLGLVRDDIRLDEVFEEPLLHIPPRFPAGLTGSRWKKSILGPAFKGCQDRVPMLDASCFGHGKDTPNGSTPGDATGFP